MPEFNVKNYVSRETYEKFICYESLIRKWNRKTSLIQISTIDNFFHRHILDSLQLVPLLYKYIPNLTININFPNVNENDFNCISTFLNTKPYISLDKIPVNLVNPSIIDIGTGAGLPGMVLAMCGFGNVCLVESNYRKCLFLEELARQTNTNVQIINKRIENVENQYDIILSRAMTNLQMLLNYFSNVSRETNSVAIFHKGNNFIKEIKNIEKSNLYNIKYYSSITSIGSTLLHITKNSPNHQFLL